MGGPVQTFLSEIIGIFSFLAMASWHLEFFSTYILLSQPLENEVIVNLTLSWVFSEMHLYNQIQVT